MRCSGIMSADVESRPPGRYGNSEVRMTAFIFVINPPLKREVFATL
jgi:hypothetical protein